ncbi:MAG: prolyl oligopeptidase family serine peptidase [Acidobacteriota bacterium]|nr:prolyl oligopeptidase family serine peptidase [Acidobacteriota bacterium]
MNRSRLQFVTSSFQRAFLSLAIVVLSLSVLSLSQFIPQTQAQNEQRLTSAPANNGSGDTAKIVYPETRKDETVDDYFGTKVPDPYRWLEDDHSAETGKWVEAQNKVTFAYLDKIPYRQKIKDRLTQLYNYPRYSAPTRRGDTFFFTKNDGLQNQSVWYVQKGLNGAPEVLIDPNKLSTDGTSRLTVFSLSKDGKYFGYGVSKGGSDWQEFFVMDVAAKKTLPETLPWVKFSSISWAGDGFYYSRYPAPEKGKELTTKNENNQVYFHKVGTPGSADVLIIEDKEHPQRFLSIDTTEDERFAILSTSEGDKQGNALYFREQSQTGDKFIPIVSEIGEDSYSIVDNIGDKFLIQTNHKAPNGRVFFFDPKMPEEKNWKDVIPEKPEPLENVSAAGGKLFLSYLKDVASRAYVYSLEGKLENEIKLPGLGAASGFGGRGDSKFIFYTFTSFNFAPTIYKYDIATKKSSLFREPEIPGFKSTDYETTQVFYNSKDGTRVPMFIVHKKGLKLDGNNPTLLYGYGGFNISITPSFNSLRLALLEQGFVYASANMRGGAEYGEQWHESGTKLKKQNVFDDFIAAAEYLIAQKYTSPDKLSIQGASNGGLLIGAVMNQRPELFKAAIPQVGVMDMLRFHKFTIGWAWVADYGSSADAQQFKAIYAYSPLHNLRVGAKYPATLITTADHDDRVVPAHSFKYAAALQAAQGGDAPVLIRINTKSGHGSSSTTKVIEETADIYSFLMWNLGLTPK